MGAPTRPGRLLRCLLPLLIAAATGCSAQGSPEREEPERPALGLFTTLPIYWAEADSVSAYLSGTSQRHWVRSLLESRYRIRLLDTLAPAADAEGVPLVGLSALVLAQPRVLSPQENVALDRWVREGGRLLLFADPMLTGHSAFGIGDKRRPQDVILLSPLLSHWGLRLEFDEAQPLEERTTMVLGQPVPVQLAGRFALDPEGEGGAACALGAEGLLAQCTIGQGRAVILADAHLLEEEGRAQDGRRDALARLLDASFAR